MPTSPGSSSDSLWQYPDFIALWLSRAASSFGFQMLSVAVGWQIYTITGHAFDLGLIGLVQFIPSILLTLPAGHVADQFERRHVVLAGQILAGSAIILLGVLSRHQYIKETSILLLVFIIGVGKTFETPAMQSLLPRLVPPALLPRAVTMSTSALQMAVILGPALGGLLYVAGPFVVYLTAAILYMLAAVTVLLVRHRHRPERREPASLRTLLAGIHFIRHHKDVLGVISLDLFAVLLGGTTALLPIFAKDILHTGAWGLGLLRAAPAAGALLISIWLTRQKMHRHTGMIMFVSVAGFGLCTLIFALSGQLWLSLSALTALGAFDMVSMVIRNSMVQLDTPDTMRGRVNAVNAIFINTSNQLGEFESGMVAAWLGTVPAAIVGGIGTLFIVGVWMTLFPALPQTSATSVWVQRNVNTIATG